MTVFMLHLYPSYSLSQQKCGPDSPNKRVSWYFRQLRLALAKEAAKYPSSSYFTYTSSLRDSFGHAHGKTACP